VWSSVWGGLPRAGEPPERLPGPPLRHEGWHHRASDPKSSRSGSYFPDWLLERRKWAETALTTVVATYYLLGVSTRRLVRLAEALGITRLSKSQVSEMPKELDGLVESFRTRPLNQGPHRFVWADALVVKVREGGRTVGVHVLIATGVAAEGRREILGCEVTSAENGAGWLAFFEKPGRPRAVRGAPGHLRCPPGPRRGDQGESSWGLLAAVPDPLPAGSAHQGGQVASSPCVATLVRTIFDQPDATEVEAQFQRVVDALAGKLPQGCLTPRASP
jgi:putative transposase